MEYQDKYLKYKYKYLTLKETINNNHLIGGSKNKIKKRKISRTIKEPFDIHFVGKSYYDFFKKTLKDYHYLKNQDGFNISACKLDDETELYCLRFLGTIPAYFGEEIIPGNFSNISKKFIENKLKLEEKNIYKANMKYGKNFFWNSWNDTLIDNTIFFVGSYKNGKLIINTNIKPYVISNEKAFNKISEKILIMNDFRLININGKIYCYDSLISSILEIKIINNNIYIPLYLDDPIFEKNFFYFKKKLCSAIDTNNKLEKYGYNTFEKTYDKNWSLMSIVKIDNENYFEFLNWYVNGYVINTLVDMKTGLGYSKKIIKMEKDKIDGLGTDSMPLFSLGSPFIQLPSDDANIDFYGICAGHTKLIIGKKYKNDNITDFLEEKKAKLNVLENYIEHNSYIYMAYFIKLIKYKDGSYKMYISDSYLYTDLNQKYIFSICFPMGLFEKDNKICMTYGYGDYYNCLIEFDKEKLINDIKHDVSNFEEKDYKFNIIY